MITAKQLLESGAHFGHRASRWNPKMGPYIHGKRSGVHIIDVRRTIRGLVEACNYLKQESRGGGEFLFVGTKRQARDSVKTHAERCGMHQVTERWLGGTLTNLRTIREQVARLEELELMEADGSLKEYSKKMISSLRREKRKILRNLSGIRNMKKPPRALIIVDPKRERNAVAEASKLGLITIGLLDTDCDPDPIDVPIPVNDDAARAIDVVIAQLADAVLEGKGQGTTPIVTAQTAAVSFGGSDDDEDDDAPAPAPAAEKPAEAAEKPAEEPVEAPAEAAAAGDEKTS